jgi:hypothetical protein
VRDLAAVARSGLITHFAKAVICPLLRSLSYSGKWRKRAKCRSTLRRICNEYSKIARQVCPNEDAITLLSADHAEVKELFKEFQDLKEEDGSAEDKFELVTQICHELKIHTEIEEEIFYPAVRKAIDDGDLLDEALIEHSAAKELIAQLEEMSPGDELYDARVIVLGEQIEHTSRRKKAS